MLFELVFYERKTFFYPRHYKIVQKMNYEILIITISWSASLSFTHNYKLYFMTFPDIFLVIKTYISRLNLTKQIEKNLYKEKQTSDDMINKKQQYLPYHNWFDFIILKRNSLISIIMFELQISLWSYVHMSICLNVKWMILITLIHHLWNKKNILIPFCNTYSFWKSDM